MSGTSLQNTTFKHGVGCSYCHNTGYKGQIGVFELLEMTPDVADALRLNNTGEFGRLIKEDKNFKPLIVSALELVAEEITTIKEVIRITGETLYSE